MARSKDILIIGAGLAGIEASLLCASSGRKVYLVERESYFGGSAIKSEEVFPLMECATCMLAPKQSEVLENKNIELLTLSEIESVTGSAGDFEVKIKKKARYVSIADCIGCGACFDPCPVEVDNEFEEGLTKRKAIYIPCAGALPNVPMIDMTNCVRRSGEDCHLCQDACMFEAIRYDDRDEELTLKVGAIIVATGFRFGDVSRFVQFGYGKLKNVLHAFEFERLRASNGPTSGEIKTSDGRSPSSLALIHCVGRKEVGYCSQICCMYLAKFAHYAFDKLEGVKIYQFYREASIPGKGNQHFYREVMEKGVVSIRSDQIEISGGDPQLTIRYRRDGKEESVQVDMVILAPPIEPHPETKRLAELLNLELDEFGFIKKNGVETSRSGIFAAGCATGPKSMEEVIVEAEAAASGAIFITEDG